MVKKVVIPAINSVLTVVVFGSEPNNAFNLFISYITIVFSLFYLPHFQNLVILFSGKTKIIKNNEECLILQVFNSLECLILQISAYQNALFYTFRGIQNALFCKFRYKLNHHTNLHIKLEKIWLKADYPLYPPNVNKSKS